jgi:hypothetical protein
MNKATVLCLFMLLVGQCLSSPLPTYLWNVETDVPFEYTLPGDQTVYFKVLAPRDYIGKDYFHFTIYPCEGSVTWYLGDVGNMESIDSQFLLYKFDTDPVIVPVDRDFSHTQNIVTVSTFTISEYKAGYYYVGVHNNDKFNATTFQGYFGQLTPYPDVGGNGNLYVTVDYYDPSQATLSWSPSSDDNVQYCVYSQDYSEFYFDETAATPTVLSTNHGSYCGYNSTLEQLGCTRQTYFNLAKLSQGHTYIFDVSVEYLDSDPNDLKSSYNGVIAYIDYFQNSASSLSFFTALVIAIVFTLF